MSGFALLNLLPPDLRRQELRRLATIRRTVFSERQDARKARAAERRLTQQVVSAFLAVDMPDASAIATSLGITRTRAWLIFKTNAPEAHRKVMRRLSTARQVDRERLAKGITPDRYRAFRVPVTIAGVRYASISDAARATGLNVQTISKRMKSGRYVTA